MDLAAPRRLELVGSSGTQGSRPSLEPKDYLMFAIAYWCGEKFGWLKGDGRYPSNIDAIKAIISTTNACHKASANVISMRVVPA